MRKRVGICALVFLMLGVLTVPALAAKPESTDPGIYDLVVGDGFTVTPQTADGVDVPENSGFYANAEKLQVTIPGSAAASGTYNLIFARSGTATDKPTEDNLVYINQETADQNGVSFTVYPSELKADVTYYVFLSSNTSAQTEVAHFNYYLPYTLGDVNGDTKIDVTDASLVLQIAALIKTNATETELAAADVNRDGKYDVTDASLILQYAALLITEFPVA